MDTAENSTRPQRWAHVVGAPSIHAGKHIAPIILRNQIEDHRQFWDASVVCRNPLAWGPRGRQQLSTLAARLEVSLKGLVRSLNELILPEVSGNRPRIFEFPAD